MAGRRKSQHAGREQATGRAATFGELQALLGKRPEQLQKVIGLPGARLMLPIDGRGARVLVGVQKGERSKIPAHVTMEWRGQHLVIPLEVDEKYLTATIF